MTTNGDRSSRDRVLSELREAGKLVVVAHENPDGDAIGSLVAMRGILTEIGKDCVMFIDGRDLPLPQEYRFLPLDGLVSEPPADVSERTIVFLDCGNIERNPAEAFRRAGGDGHHILNIDHHHDNTHFGSVNLVVPEASCTAEIVWDLMHALDVPADAHDRRCALRRADHRHRALHVREHRHAGPPHGRRPDRRRRGCPRHLPPRLRGRALRQAGPAGARAGQRRALRRRPPDDHRPVRR